jgi:hypothetical protein
MPKGSVESNRAMPATIQAAERVASIMQSWSNGDLLWQQQFVAISGS